MESLMSILSSQRVEKHHSGYTLNFHLGPGGPLPRMYRASAWIVVPEEPILIRVVQASTATSRGSAVPGGAQTGSRWT